MGTVVRRPGERQGLPELGRFPPPDRDPGGNEPSVPSPEAGHPPPGQAPAGVVERQVWYVKQQRRSHSWGDDKMKRLHLVTWLVAAAFVAACGSAGTAGGGNTNSYSGKTIKLGAILSITGAGGVYGPQSRDGMNLAVKQINNSGGVNGAQIALTINDDASLQPQSAQVAQKLIQEEQDMALLGPTLSNSAVAVHPLAESLKTPILAVSTTGINIVPNCNAPSTVPCKYVFRDSLGEETAIPDNIKSYAADSHPATGVLLVAQDDKFSSDGGTIVQATLGQQNMQLLKIIKINNAAGDLSLYV